MPTTILNATFDGVTPVTNIYGGTDSFSSGGFLGYYSQFEEDISNDLVVNASLTGSNWTVATFRVGAESGETQLNLTDLDGGSGRKIDFLKLGSNSDVDLISTSVRYIQGGEGNLHDLTLGSAYVSLVNLGADRNVVTTGSGYVGNIENNRGTSEVTVNGDVGGILTSHDDDELVINSGNVKSASLRGGNDTVTGFNDALLNSLDIFGGENTITLNDTSRIGTVAATGDNTVTLLDESRIYALKLDLGENTVTTGNGYFESFFSFEASNDVVIGDGGAGQIQFLSNTQQTHTVVGQGYIGSFQARDSASTSSDDQTTDITLRGGAQSIYLGSGDDLVRVGNGYVDFINTRAGNDVVRINDGPVGSVYLGDGNDRIRAGDGYIEYISGGGGNDRIDLRGGGAGLVRGNDGNDKFFIRELNDPNFGTVIQGGSGTDTIDFSAIATTGVSFSLDEDGTFQNIGRSDPSVGGPPVIGYLSAVSIERLVGTEQDDNLTGDEGANRLFGGDGDDVLAGGVGNDRLYGEGGSDTFVFETASGTDRVYGWEDGTDTLQIIGHQGGFDELDISDRNDDLLVRYDGGRFYLMDQAGVTLTDADFDFLF